MAEQANDKSKQLTWQQKLDQGIPLNSFDEIKADADFNYRQRLREETERQEFEARKNAVRSARTAPPEEAPAAPASPTKKGKDE